MSPIAYGLMAAGQSAGPVAGALVAVVLMQIEPRDPQETGPSHGGTGQG